MVSFNLPGFLLMARFITPSHTNSEAVDPASLLNCSTKYKNSKHNNIALSIFFTLHKLIYLIQCLIRRMGENSRPLDEDFRDIIVFFCQPTLRRPLR